MPEKTHRVRNLGIRRVKVSDIVPNPANFRVHNDAQRQGLSGVVDQIGWYGYPDVFEHPDHPGRVMLIDGELRYEHLLERFGPDAEVEVNVTDHSPDEAELALLTHDPLSAMATHNAEMLSKLLDTVKPDNEQLQAMLAALKRQAITAGAPLRGEIAHKELPPQDARIGDVWRLGRHRLMVGDSTDAASVGRLLDGATPFLMVTDPPYGVNYDPGWRDVTSSRGTVLATSEVKNDGRSDWADAYKLFPGDVAYVWHSAVHSLSVLRSLEEAKYLIRAQIIWRKKEIVIGRGHYHWRHEPCLYCVRKGAGSAKWRGGRKESTVWDIANMHATKGNVDDGKTAHSTQKPVECMLRPIKNHGDAGDAVYDPFLGSGTTIIACEQLGRSCFGMELEPSYADIVIQRWEAFTGERAELAHRDPSSAASTKRKRTNANHKKAGKPKSNDPAR